ncbi:MAG: TatD family hydrolase [Prevotellaceae bacterium]|jgi:TatD DNase family protein|nr:TatD family hydrolase [Prevotellaceae bacterium]
MIDTHSHIYSEEFDDDRELVIQRAKDAGVKKIILPNVDSDSLARMLVLEEQCPGFCFAAVGLHPTSVKDDYEQALSLVKKELERREYIAIGEIGLDLYWDKTYFKEQQKAFVCQIEWALEYSLPVIIHTRDSLAETIELLTPFKNSGLRGIFHSFGGSLSDAENILNFGGFLLGINGIVTFKNSGLREVLKHIDLKHIVIETDAPYLTPVPFRGKRNESAYIYYIVRELSAVYNRGEAEIISATTHNASSIFGKLELSSHFSKNA